MKHVINCTEISKMRSVSCIVINLTIETQSEFDHLRDSLGRRESDTTSEYDFFADIDKLHNEVIIK